MGCHASQIKFRDGLWVDHERKVWIRYGLCALGKLLKPSNIMCHYRSLLTFTIWYATRTKTGKAEPKITQNVTKILTMYRKRKIIIK